MDGHASWVSKPVLELMAAGGKIPEDVDGGEIIRDKDGVPTGITVADNLPHYYSRIAQGHSWTMR